MKRHEDNAGFVLSLTVLACSIEQLSHAKSSTIETTENASKKLETYDSNTQKKTVPAFDRILPIETSISMGRLTS